MEVHLKTVAIVYGLNEVGELHCLVGEQHKWISFDQN